MRNATCRGRLLRGLSSAIGFPHLKSLSASPFPYGPRLRPFAGEADPIKFYHDSSGWTLVFAVLVSAVVCEAFGIWMGWLRHIEFGDAMRGSSARRGG
jgi:hypothetical protein